MGQEGGVFYSLHLLAARPAVHTGLSTDSISQRDMRPPSPAQPWARTLLSPLLERGMLLRAGAEEGFLKNWGN